jgi:hypothetical protein
MNWDFDIDYNNVDEDGNHVVALPRRFVVRDVDGVRALVSLVKVVPGKGDPTRWFASVKIIEALEDIYR